MTGNTKLLAGLLGVIVIGYGLFLVANDYVIKPWLAQEEELTRKERELDQKKNDQLRALMAEKELASWKSKALPADINDAKTIYLAFLNATAEKAGLSKPTIKVTSTTPVASGSSGIGRAATQKIDMTKLAFTIDATSTLEKLGTFLNRFYDTYVLHQIRSLTISPVSEGGTLRNYKLTMSVEAISMPDAVSKNGMPIAPATKPNDPATPSVPTATDLLATKSPFQPSKMVAQSERRQSDERDDYRITAMIEESGVWQAWITNTKSNKVTRLKEGEELSISGFKAKLIAGTPRQATFEMGDKRGVVSAGQTMSSWKEIKNNN